MGGWDGQKPKLLVKFANHCFYGLFDNYIRLRVDKSGVGPQFWDFSQKNTFFSWASPELDYSEALFYGDDGRVLEDHSEPF